jgi:hypothetical protein
LGPRQQKHRVARADSYDANDPDDGPYDPNDEAATEAFLTEAEILTGYPEQGSSRRRVCRSMSGKSG